MALLEVRGLTKTYAARTGGAARKALDSISLSVEAGEFVAVMGPSGSGKTTLLNLVALIDEPDSGEILFGSRDPRGLRGSGLAAFRRRNLGYVFQDSALIDTMTLGENIALPLALDRVPGAEIEGRVAAMAERLGISEALGRYPCEVSGGQRQRAASARALACGPALLLADEPTGALDSKSGRALMECYASLNASLGNAVLMVTHDPFAASWAKRAVFLRDGRVFSELRRTGGRREFFDRVMEAQAAMEGGGA